VGSLVVLSPFWMMTSCVTDLCAEALRLGRMLASLTAHDTESLNLLALMELRASRLKARSGPDGEPVLLMDQGPTRWTTSSSARTCHSRAHRPAGRHGRAVRPCRLRSPPAMREPLYDGLAQICPAPVVELNRGVAVAQAFGPQPRLVPSCVVDDDEIRGLPLKWS
jgi:RNA polymerase sigma-70 factor (ECF subfamily)